MFDLSPETKAFHTPYGLEIIRENMNKINNERTPGVVGHEFSHWRDAQAGIPTRTQLSEYKAYNLQRSFDDALGFNKFQNWMADVLGFEKDWWAMQQVKKYYSHYPDGGLAAYRNK